MEGSTDVPPENSFTVVVVAARGLSAVVTVVTVLLSVSGIRYRGMGGERHVHQHSVNR